MKKPAVLFDYDGVLVDSLDWFLDAFLEACHDHGCHQVRTKDDFLALFDTNFYDGMAKAGLTGQTRTDVFHGMAARLAKKADRYAFFPGIPEALRRLAAFADIYIISSNDSAVVRDFMHAHDLGLCLDILGGDRDTSKVRKIRSVAALHPGAPLIYVGDTTGDMREAREGGAVAVGAGWGWHGPERLSLAHPDHLLREPSELPACVASILHCPGPA